MLKVVLPLLLGFFLVWYALSKVSVHYLLTYAKTAHYTWIALAVFFGFLSHLSRAYRWLFVLEPMGYKIKFANSVMAIFVAYMVNYTIPRTGEVARAYTIKNYEGVPFEKGIGTIIAERAFDLIMLLIVVAITLFIQFHFIYSFLVQLFNPIKTISILVGSFVFGLILFRAVKRSHSKVAIKVKAITKGILEGLLSVLKMEKKGAFIVHTLFIWTMYILMFYTTSLAFSDLKSISIGAILVAFIAASLSIAATNGGIGSYPLAIYAAFSIFGIAKGPSMAFGWLMWLSQTLMIIISGSVSLLYLPIYNRNPIDKKAHLF